MSVTLRDRGWSLQLYSKRCNLSISYSKKKGVYLE